MNDKYENVLLLHIRAEIKSIVLIAEILFYGNVGGNAFAFKDMNYLLGLDFEIYRCFARNESILSYGEKMLRITSFPTIRLISLRCCMSR